MSERRTRAAKLRRRAARRRRRRRMLRVVAITASVAIVASALLVALAWAMSPRQETYCVAQPQDFPDAGIAGWDGEQLENAAVIVRTAQGMGFERDGQIIGVMAAMGESSLRNIDYGDWETSGVTNPDGTRTSSIGLFQQQAWWGSVEQRMDPATAASLFYAKLARIAGWAQQPPSQAIHRVQVNTDPEHYAQFADDAEAVVDALSGECTAPLG
ncbi:hypothetical protein [Microbacterium alcoholitolerans]|uniref:hypothetical protein n=1 Tax=unclassified Microbacterium TaxID=2609290 RepID=UPI003D181001